MNSEPYEKVLRETILPQLEKGRPNFDKPHTEAVVHYIKEIVSHSEDLQLDLDVLIIAAYAHDWGYTELFEDGVVLQYDNVLGAKKLHMEEGARMTADLLTLGEFNFLTTEQKERVVHLVAVHDNINSLLDIDEIVLMEADTLGGLDSNRVKPSFDTSSNDRYMDGVKRKRYPLFKTEYGKKMFDILYALRQSYYKKNLKQL